MLKNEHYSVEKPKRKPLTIFTRYTERKIINEVFIHGVRRLLLEKEYIHVLLATYIQAIRIYTGGKNGK